MKEHSTKPFLDPSPTPSPTAEPVSQAGESPHLEFSRLRWALTGILRLLYRRWTRIAAHLFPEGSPTARLARALHIPLPDQLNLSWITGQLAVGGRIHPQDIKALARLGVTHVVDTRAEYVDDAAALARAGIELLHLPTPDTQPLTLAQMLEGARWVHERLQRGGRVLIHCEHGVGRSALLACAVLVYGGMHARDALALVQQQRWQAAPNQKQVERLREFESEVKALRSR
jgi:protein-tyrosine phosphatase